MGIFFSMLSKRSRFVLSLGPLETQASEGLQVILLALASEWGLRHDTLKVIKDRHEFVDLSTP
jgi:hypothetical protein|tara:strand:+ start:26750 stop:26938 length:189 start_codon:yes stop_codon:yes gene_type:complete